MSDSAVSHASRASDAGRASVELPRLVYVGDVPVESTYHGSALFYRLLQSYPPERLRIIEGSLASSLPERRLPAVGYESLFVGHARVLNSRLHEWYSAWLSLSAKARARRVAPGDGFMPDAVLTVAHGHSWLTAAEYARRIGKPLHLIVHDDWPRLIRLPGGLAERVDRDFGRVYRAAASRLCVSPFMVEEYLARYEAEGRVLYPSRAQNGPSFSHPPERLRERGRGLVVAFAGNLFTRDDLRLLRALAESLQARGGRVLVFGPVSRGLADTLQAGVTNIHVCGLVSAAELVNRLRAEADVLFVPMSFESAHAANARINFPSKLTDYTAVGLPLLIWGPEYSSVVRWASSNQGVAEVVATDEIGALAAAVGRLAEEPEHRMALATRALEVGARFFSHTAAWNVFRHALTAASDA